MLLLRDDTLFIPLEPAEGELSAELQEPIGGTSRMIVRLDGKQIHYGPLFYVMRATEKGSLTATIDPRTGLIKYRGRGSVTIRAVINGRHFDLPLVVS